MRYTIPALLWLSLLCLKSEGQLQATHIESPTYPAMARWALIQGKVEVEVAIDADGRVRSAEARGGHEFLREAAEKNVRQWRFAPYAESKQPRTQIVEFTFELEKERVEHACARVSFDLPLRVRIVSNPPPINVHKTHVEPKGRN